MQFLLLLVFTLSFIYLAHSAILKSSMINNYPQIAVLGCDSNKANLYYDNQRQIWVEHLVSSCVNNEQSILEFCQQAYPSLDIRNIVRLETVLRFENWCELLPSMDNTIPRCKIESQTEELVQPFRCLHMNSQREEIYFPTNDCVINHINNTGECLRAEKWQQYASLDCSKKSMLLNSSIMSPNWCGLSAFRGIEFICCPFKDSNAKINLDQQDDSALNEDEPIQEFIFVPKTSTAETHRKIIAMSLGSREPNWMDDYRRWNTDSGYFADDEDTSDDQEEIKLSSTRKSHLTINEHERFTKEKDEFKRKYKEQIDQLKSRWDNRQMDIKLLANQNPDDAQKQYEKTEMEFRREYDTIKQTAGRERARINQLHETNLDKVIDSAKNETNQKLIAVWNENPLKTKNIEEALYNYLHVLLRDRIHLVNRYERLRAVDPDQAKRKRVSIHNRLSSIANQINDALNQLRHYSTIQSEIQPRIDTLIDEYEEVNRAADKLVYNYIVSLSTTTTTVKNRLLPLGRDENKIYPFAETSSNKIDEDDNNNNEYNYDTDEEYDDNDDDENTTKTTTINNNDQVDIGDSDWDLDADSDATFNVKIDPNTDEQVYDDIRPLVPNNEINNNRIPRNLFITYLPYIVGSSLILCIISGLLIFRCIIQQRRKHQYGGKYEKNYAFAEVDACTPEEKALHALQMNGYENPTYKFFESQTPKC